jgi:acyl-CoA synthetase (AMP-forming)/AMP-acid ligase II
LDWHAKRSPQKAALVCDDRQLNWLELSETVENTASAIYSHLGNAKKQEVISLLLPNGWQFVVVYLAAVKLGHIVMPLDPAYKKLELDAILNQIPGKLLITDVAYSSQLGTHDQKLILVDDLLNFKADDFETLRLDANTQIASLTFTSGTTGKPKAVPNTHANHIWNIEVCSMVWDWTPSDSLLISLPLSHWYGIVMGLTGALYHGNTLYLQTWFDEKATLEALASGKISLFTHAASAYVKLLQSGGEYDLHGVRLCISGGAPLPPPVWEGFKAKYKIEILETYGSSETGRIAGNSLDKRVLGSPGKVFPGVSAKTDKNGEVLVKSPGLFPGYFNNKAATKAGLTDDGYWRTGDIGEIKNDYVYLKGRIQERIRRFGYTISPRDVEWALHQHPKISDIYVMGIQASGVPNDELVYFIVGSIEKEELKSFCKTNLLFAWRPDRVIFLDDLPRTRSGKPKIDQLKALAT